MRRRWFGWWFGICGVFLLGAQFVRPAMKDPPHKKLMEGAVIPGNVTAILNRACQDCHSNNTKWPWYAKVAPVSFLVANDVRKGREFLNLSEWEQYSRGQKVGYLSSMSEATRDRKMPPRVYSTLHADARLSDEERKVIARWAAEERQRLWKVD
jgi:Haem-binding domain